MKALSSLLRGDMCVKRNPLVMKKNYFSSKNLCIMLFWRQKAKVSTFRGAHVQEVRFNFLSSKTATLSYYAVVFFKKSDKCLTPRGDSRIK